MAQVRVVFQLESKKKVRRLSLECDFVSAVNGAFPELHDRAWHCEYAIDGGVDWIETSDEFECAALVAVDAHDRAWHCEYAIDGGVDWIETSDEFECAALVAADEHDGKMELKIVAILSSKDGELSGNVEAPPKPKPRVKRLKVEGVPAKEFESVPHLEELVFILKRQLEATSDVHIWSQFQRPWRSKESRMGGNKRRGPDSSSRKPTPSPATTSSSAVAPSSATASSSAAASDSATAPSSAATAVPNDRPIKRQKVQHSQSSTSATTSPGSATASPVHEHKPEAPAGDVDAESATTSAAGADADVKSACTLSRSQSAATALMPMDTSSTSGNGEPSSSTSTTSRRAPDAEADAEADAGSNRSGRQSRDRRKNIESEEAAETATDTATTTDPPPKPSPFANFPPAAPRQPSAQPSLAELNELLLSLSRKGLAEFKNVAAPPPHASPHQHRHHHHRPSTVTYWRLVTEEVEVD